MTQSDKKEEKEKDKETQKATPVSEKEKKLSGKVADKLKFYGVVAFLSLLCAGFIWFIFKPDASETVEDVRHQYNDTRRYRTRNDGRQTEGLRTGSNEKTQAGKGENLAGRGRGLPDAGYYGRNETGRRCTQSGCCPGVQRETTADFKADHLVLSGTEGESEGGRTGAAGKGA